MLNVIVRVCVSVSVVYNSICATPLPDQSQQFNVCMPHSVKAHSIEIAIQLGSCVCVCIYFGAV